MKRINTVDCLVTVSQHRSILRSPVQGHVRRAYGRLSKEHQAKALYFRKAWANLPPPLHELPMLLHGRQQSARLLLTSKAFVLDTYFIIHLPKHSYTLNNTPADPRFWDRKTWSHQHMFRCVTLGLDPGNRAWAFTFWSLLRLVGLAGDDYLAPAPDQVVDRRPGVDPRVRRPARDVPDDDLKAAVVRRI